MLIFKKNAKSLLRKKIIFLSYFFSGLLFLIVLIPSKVLGEEYYFWVRNICWISSSVNIMPDPLENWCPGGSYGVELGSRCFGGWEKFKCLKEIKYDTHGPFPDFDGGYFYWDMYGFDCAACRLCRDCTTGCGDYNCASTERPTNWDCSSSGSGEYSISGFGPYNSCSYDCAQSSSCAPSCTDTCSSLGYSCGTHTICGVSTNCGSCSGSMCGPTTYSCSANNVWSRQSNWLTNTCNSGLCSYQISVLGGCSSSQNCGTAICKNSYNYEYCNGSEIRGKTMGYQEICRSNSLGCGENFRECNDYHIKNCEVGYTCRITGQDIFGRDKAECVPKSSNWTED